MQGQGSPHGGHECRNPCVPCIDTVPAKNPPPPLGTGPDMDSEQRRGRPKDLSGRKCTCLRRGRGQGRNEGEKELNVCEGYLIKLSLWSFHLLQTSRGLPGI